MNTQYTTPSASTAPPLLDEPAPEPIRRVSIICSKGSLDMAYPGLILANAARMSGIEATLFFTFWGLDIITKSKVDSLHVSTVGNPSMPMPTMLGGLPGMESFASRMMKKEIAKLEIPTIRELLSDLSDSGAHLYGCQMAMDMFHLTREDLVPQVEDVISAMDFFDKSAGAQIIFI
ncbi:MAG TPA: DsrE/DsrF/DrsH-like family protein [Thermoanaerobaculia bacterium]|nr:DsrE/DsrF/DrsH-like family protein [Thermoanaerobaculia bacterium]